MLYSDTLMAFSLTTISAYLSLSLGKGAKVGGDWGGSIQRPDTALSQGEAFSMLSAEIW